MVLTVLRVVLGLLFIVSGSIKISNYELFYHSVERFWILPAELNYFAMFTIPMVETVCGILLVMNIFRAWVTSVLIFLLGAFGAGKAINLYKGEQFSCECFGSLKILVATVCLAINRFCLFSDSVYSSRTPEYSRFFFKSSNSFLKRAVLLVAVVARDMPIIPKINPIVSTLALLY